MGLQIEDGATGTTAEVDSDRRMSVKALSTPPLEIASDDRGDAAYFSSTFAASAGEEVVSIRNTETTRNLHITRMSMSATAVTNWTLFEVTSGTAAGTTLTYLNPNLGSGTVNSVTAFGNASVTGTLTGDTILHTRTLASTPAELFLEGSLILTNTDEISLTTSASATVFVTIVGFWDK